MTEGNTPQEVPQLTDGQVQNPEELRRQRMTIIVIAIIVFVAILIFVGLIIFLLNPNTPQIYVARIRDVFIIIFAIQSLFIGLVLVILMVQLARLTNLLQNEIKPILESTNDAARLDSPIMDGEKTTLLDFISDEKSPAPDSVMATRALTQEIREALNVLTPREEEIIRLRFGIDQDGTYTLDEIGRRFDLTRERIRQIEKRALEKLSEADAGDVLRSFLAV